MFTFVHRCCSKLVESPDCERIPELFCLVENLVQDRVKGQERDSVKSEHGP